MNTTINSHFLPTPPHWARSFSARCTSWIPPLPQIEFRYHWYSLKERFGTPSPLLQGISSLSRQSDIASTFDKPDQDLLCTAFSSPEFSLYAPFISRIFEKLTDEQLNNTLEQLFAENADEQSGRLIKRLMSVLTLQKIESVIHSNASFSHFTTAADAAAAINNRVQHHYEAQETSTWNTVKRTAYYYSITILDKVVVTTLTILNLDDLDFENDEDDMGGYRNYSRYLAFQSLFEMASAALVALSLLLGSIVLTAAIAGIVIVAGCAICFCYFKWLKPCPENIPPFKNLVTEATKGRIAPVHGRNKEIGKLIEALSSNQSTMRQHPILVGKTGVGKTEIINGLALRIAAGDVPDALKGKKLFSVNTADLIKSGGGGRGSAIERMQRAMKGRHDDAIFFFDEIHSAFLSNSQEQNPLSQQLKTLFDPGPNGFRYCIAATTNAEFDKYLAEDAAFRRRFDEIDVKPLEPNKILATLTDMVKREAPDLTITPEAISIVANLPNDPTFADRPQPLQSKAILAKAFTRVRSPKQTEVIEKLDSLKDRQEELECLHNISYGLEALPYTEQGHQHTEELRVVNAEIANLQAQLDAAQSSLNSFLNLVKKRNELKITTDIAAMQIASKEPSENDLKAFILQLHYLQIALDRSIKEKQNDIQNANTVVNKAFIEKIIEEERKKLETAKHKHREHQKREEQNSFEQELATAQRKRNIEKALATGG